MLKKENEDRFWYEVGIISLLIIIGWFFLLSPTYYKIQQAQKKIKNFTTGIQGFFQSEYSPEEATLEKLKMENKKLNDLLGNYIKDTSLEMTPKTVSISYFRELLRNKREFIVQKLKDKNLEHDIDKNLGFPEKIYTSNFSDYYILYLELANSIINKIIDIENAKFEKINVYYPELQKAKNTGENFIDDYKIRLTFTSDIYFVMKVIHKFSVPKKNAQFLVLEDAKLEKVENKGIRSTFIFNAAKINPSGKIKASSKENIGIYNNKKKHIPLWERY